MINHFKTNKIMEKIKEYLIKQIDSLEAIKKHKYLSEYGSGQLYAFKDILKKCNE